MIFSRLGFWVGDHGKREKSWTRSVGHQIWQPVWGGQKGYGNELFVAQPALGQKVLQQSRGGRIQNKFDNCEWCFPHILYHEIHLLILKLQINLWMKLLLCVEMEHLANLRFFATIKNTNCLILFVGQNIGPKSQHATLRKVQKVYWTSCHLVVSKNNGTPKSSILIGFSIVNHPFWDTPIFGNTHFGISNFTSLVWCFLFRNSVSISPDILALSLSFLKGPGTPHGLAPWTSPSFASKNFSRCVKEE